MPRESVVDRNTLIKLLCEHLTETERASQLGVARSSYYAQLAKLTKEGVLVSTLPDDMHITTAHPRSTRSGTHHAPVLHVKWKNDLGIWGVQGALLDEWDNTPFRSADISVVIRWVAQVAERRTSFVVSPTLPRTSTSYGKETKSRWSTTNMVSKLPPLWQYEISRERLERLTIAVAKVIDVEAIIVPEGLLNGAS